MPSIHFDIPKQKVIVRTQYLYDMDPAKNGFTEAELISISSYPGHAPTFTALVEGKFLFHYLPINAFFQSTPSTYNSGPKKPLSLAESCYFNCPDTEVAVSVIGGLHKCLVFDKNKDFVEAGMYLMTFDWHRDNQLCHMILLETGNFVLVPSHKVIFGDGDDQLPNFKKLHATWKV